MNEKAPFNDYAIKSYGGKEWGESERKKVEPSFIFIA